MVRPQCSMILIMIVFEEIIQMVKYTLIERMVSSLLRSEMTKKGGSIIF